VNKRRYSIHIWPVFEHRGAQCLLILTRSTSPPLDQFPLRVCVCPLCIINRLWIQWPWICTHLCHIQELIRRNTVCIFVWLRHRNAWVSVQHVGLWLTPPRSVLKPPFHGVYVFVPVCVLLFCLLYVAVCSTSLVCAVRSVSKTLAREYVRCFISKNNTLNCVGQRYS